VESYPLLNEILGPRGLLEGQLRDIAWPALPGATTATFESSGDWLHVRFANGAGGEATLSFRRKHSWGGSFDGSDSPIFAVPHAISPGYVRAWFLSRGREGALIVNYRTGDLWRWMGSIWWRYPAIASNR
jgi:hypothetical protein